MATPLFTIDPDIRQAQTLPARIYSDPEVYALARERIFARSWQFVADVSVVKIPHAVFPFTLLEGCLDEPLLFTRDVSDRVHCLSNVCTHRGTLVCEGPGSEASLRCRYHGRRFDLDGTFRSMPEFEQARGFPTDRDNLPRVAWRQWGAWLLAGLAPALDFDEVFGPVTARVGWMPFDEFAFEPTRSRDYLVRANWALYCDNYLEGFHIPYVHAGLNAAIDYGQYATELFRYGNLQVGYAKPGSADPVFDLPGSSPDHGRAVAAYYFWLFPNLMLNFYPWGLSVNVVRPLGPALTKVSFLSYVWRAEKLDAGAGAGLDRVEREDEAVVEAVQRGVRSALYDRGRYSPTREQGVHHFHRLLAEFLNG
ncbi:MAG: Rieske 2Fe-2S domain-containing protein [Phycisphaerales bacterium]|nr:Rieske 2Fe-2S domain-containing protein [Phycisphaerales bacterium]